jgi:DNA-binding SARP family transcriptional activator
MDFGILGPLQIRDGDRELRLRGGKQRAILAILLLHAGEVVSSDRLIDDLWGDEPPESGVTALQVRVSQLRKALGPAAGQLETRAPGYVLRVGADELDLQRFERLVGEAERAEPEIAAGLLRNALALWRGPALADFAYEPFAQAAIGRLEELRLTALERRIEADLALGRAGALVGETEALVAEHPLRERFRAQLMLALYRSGRQAEALAAYQATREALVDGLGIEPTPALQELERAILHQDPALDLQGPPVTQRSILVAPQTDDRLDDLLALAEPLARKPPKELILTRAVPEPGALAAAAETLHVHREQLLARGLPARAAAFVSASPAADLIRLAVEQDVDLVLVEGSADRLSEEPLATLLTGAPCDVAVVVSREHPPGPVLVPFVGAEHDWAAVELGAWLAGARSVPLQLAGPSEAGRDSSRLLASASLAVQRALGVAAEPVLVEPGPDALVAAADHAGVVVVGLSERWRKEGLGPARSALATSARPPVVLVRRGLRPGGLAPNASLTRFTWSLRT